MGEAGGAHQAFGWVSVVTDETAVGGGAGNALAVAEVLADLAGETDGLLEDSEVLALGPADTVGVGDEKTGLLVDGEEAAVIAPLAGVFGGVLGAVVDDVFH